MTGSPIIKKIPGIPVQFNHEKDGHVDLMQKSRTELMDILFREETILKNKKFVEKLPDKGEKISRFRDAVASELKKRDEQEKLCDLISNLNVEERKESIEKLEWPNSNVQNQDVTDNVTEDNRNLIHILATHSGTAYSKYKLTKSADYAIPNMELYAKQLCAQLDHRSSPRRFATHRPLHDSEPPRPRNRDDSAAHATSSSPATMISLDESIRVQQRYTSAVQESEIKHAIEKLSEKSQIKLKHPRHNFMNYRITKSGEDDESESEEEILSDESEDDRSGTATIYNLIDDVDAS